eukprot:52315-Pelagomonas_calceolata.AAC.1
MAHLDKLCLLAAIHQDALIISINGHDNSHDSQQARLAWQSWRCIWALDLSSMLQVPQGYCHIPSCSTSPVCSNPLCRPARSSKNRLHPSANAVLLSMSSARSVCRAGTRPKPPP